MQEPAECGARPAQQSRWQVEVAEAELSGNATAPSEHRISAARIDLAGVNPMKCRTALSTFDSAVVVFVGQGENAQSSTADRD
jgi:hypothetical protein